MSGGNPYQQQPGGYPPQGHNPQPGPHPQQGQYPPQGYQQPYGQPGVQAPYPGAYMKPNRATMVFVFSLLSWFVCIIFGIVAFVQSKADMREMQAGVMDPSGMGLTKAAYYISMIHFIVFAALIALYVVIFAVVGASGGFN
jgi:hypothetical protein